MQLISKPQEEEYKPFAGNYIRLIGDTLDVQQLQENFDALKQYILALPAEKYNYSYAPGKWTLKEVLVHMMDTERIMAYRALCIARNDKTYFPGFEQDDYVPYSGANDRDINNIMAEYEALRASTIQLFSNFTPEAFLRIGIASNHKFSVRAFLFIIAGHEQHHLNVIKEKYAS